MNKLIISVFLLLTFYGRAQELSTIGQSNLKFYKKAIERLQKMSPGSMDYEGVIYDAEKKVAAIRKSDPNYDVSSMESEIQKYKSGNSASNEKAASDLKAAKSSAGALENFLKWTPESFKNSKSDTEFEGLEKKVNEQIEAINNFCKTGLNTNDKSALNRIEEHWDVSGSDETRLVSTKNNHEKSEGVEHAVYNYYEIKWIFNKWKAFSEVFPESESITQAKQKAEDVLNMLGSAEKVKSHAKGAKAKRIADTKMDPAVVSDAGLEAQIKKALLSSKFAAERTIIKINIVSSAWTVQKNAVTGVTLSRTKGFSAGLKEKDGKCVLLHYVDFKQDYVAGNFEQGYINLGEIVEILCENIK